VPEKAEPASPEEAQLEREVAARGHVFESLFVHGEYTVIPLPAFAYNRNEGYWVGALAPILKANPKGDLEHILAPQYLYNRYVGQTVTANYYRYQTDTVTYHAVGSLSEKIQRDVDVGFKNLGAGGGRYILGADVNWFKNPFGRFFGFGNNTSESKETNYTARETRVMLTGGVNLTPDLSVMLVERFRLVELQNGAVSSLPQTLNRFSQTPGIEGAQILGHRLTMFYDTRDTQLTPTRGSYVNFSLEFNQNVQHRDPNRWCRYTVDARHLIPHASDRMVFVAHVMIDGLDREQLARRAVPFYERPMLGGENTLRAFGLNRFIGNKALLANFEERILAGEKKFFDYTIDLEVAPFLDIGRVSQKLAIFRFDLNNAQVNPGVGFRVRARPNVVGRLDVAYGKDGGNVFVGLDYPF
jgi:outer membrane protein assembly factor BamA